MTQRTTVLNEGAYDAEFLISEANHARSRGEIKLAVDAAAYLPGTVLKLNGTEHERFDGTGTPTGILMLGVDASLEIKPATQIERDAEFVESLLVWDAAVTAGQQTTALATMKTAGLIGRASK